MSKYLIVVFFVLNSLLYSAFLENIPMKISQPDGKEIECFASGDEFFNYLHDENGFTIIQSQTDGFYYYAAKAGNKIIPSVYLVDEIDPELAGLEKNIVISREEYIERKNRFSGETRQSRAPTSGLMNNLVVYIRFSDQTEFQDPRSVFDASFNDDSPGATSVYNYYQEVSYEDLMIDSYHHPECALETNLSYQDEHPRAYYSPYNAVTNPIGYATNEERTFREHTLLANAINFIADEVPVELEIDADDDDLVDSVCFIIRGGNDAWADLLWGHRWYLFSQNVYINGKLVYDYTFQTESQFEVFVLCHELFHLLGAPDLYHYYSGGSPYGPWDLMAGGFVHMSSYMKYRYGNWIEEIPEITASGTYYLQPLTHPENNCYKISSPNSYTEYFVVEYRKQVPETYEVNLPGSGLTVSRVNILLDGEGNAAGPPDELYIFRPGGTLYSDGNIYLAHLSSDVGRSEFNDESDPYGFLSDGNLGGIFIHQIGSAADSISFILNPAEAMIMGSISSDNPGADVSEAEITIGNDTFEPEENGEFYIPYFQGNYELTVSLHGHVSQTIDIELEAYDVLELEFLLEYLEAPYDLSFTLEDLELTLNWEFDGFENENFDHFNILISLNGDYFYPFGTSTETEFTHQFASSIELYFYIEAEYTNGFSDPSNIVNVVLTGTDDEHTALLENELYANYPNPFYISEPSRSMKTNIRFDLKDNEHVVLEIFNIKGQLVKILIDDEQNPGTHLVSWNGKNENEKLISPGLYFYKLKTETFSKIRKMLIIR